MEDPALTLYEAFLSRYEQQFISAGIDHAFSPAYGGEYEWALESAVYYSIDGDITIAPDMLDKILGLFSPSTEPHQSIRSFLKKHRTDYQPKIAT